jgi:hypothetical protein
MGQGRQGSPHQGRLTSYVPFPAKPAQAGFLHGAIGFCIREVEKKITLMKTGITST